MLAHSNRAHNMYPWTYTSMVTGMVNLGLWKGLSKEESLEVGFELRLSREILQTGRQWIPDIFSDETKHVYRIQELCASQGGRPGLPALMSLMVSVDVKQHWTVLRHWSQFVLICQPTSEDIKLYIIIKHVYVLIADKRTRWKEPMANLCATWTSTPIASIT